MNFIEQIKHSLNDQAASRGVGSMIHPKVVVDRYALMSLLDDQEQLDNYVRTIHSQKRHDPPDLQLEILLRHLFTREERNSNRVMLLIMQILEPLIKERIKIEKREERYGKGKGNAVPPGRPDRL